VSRWISGVAACGLVAAALAGCTSRKPEGTVTITVTPTHSSSPRSSPAASSAPTSSPTPSPTTLTKLAGTCDSLLPSIAVADVVGGGPIVGREAFVVGPPQKDIGRIAYLNCRYGVTGTGTAAKPKIEIGVSLYSTPAAAAARITATTDDYTGHGATGTEVSVAGVPATLLTGGSGADYAAPLLVLSSGQRTVAVTVYPAFAAGAVATKDAEALAKLALAKTAP
jgi:hypothetical protein